MNGCVRQMKLLKIKITSLDLNMYEACVILFQTIIVVLLKWDFGLNFL